MAEVLRSSFREWLPEVKKIIEEASFIAFDLEFLGLPSSACDGSVPTLFDDTQQRYEKVVKSVRRYPPCQLGIACYKEMNEGAAYEVESFCIPVFKLVPRKVYSFSLSAVTFLGAHNFDFNQFVAEGVTYANRREIAQLRKELISGEIEYDIFGDNLEHRIQMLKMNLQRIAEKTVKECPPSFRQHFLPSPGRLRLPHPILVELVRSTEFVDMDTIDQTVHPPWDRPLTAIEAAALVYALSNEHRNLEFHVNHTRTVLYSAEVPLIVRNAVSDEGRITMAMEDLLLEVSGAAEIVKAIMERKCPLVGHNCFLDLMYLSDSFIENVPDHYDEWKSHVRSFFPTIFDTKIIACCLKTPLGENGVSDHSLKMLGTFFDSPSCGQILPFAYPALTDGPYSRGVFDDGEHFHNAAYDARTTGSVFLKLLYLYAHTKSAGLSDFSRLWPLRKLVFACRVDVANRVPLPLIDYLHCYLPGPDPHGHRPTPLKARRKRPWPLMERLPRRLRHFVDVLADVILDPPPISWNEMIPVQGELKREMGGFRVDCKLSETEPGVLLVATNTPKTFARTARYLAAHAWLQPVDDKRLGAAVSWEELLMSSEEHKKRKRRRRKTTCRSGPDSSESSTERIALWTAAVTAILFAFGTVVYVRKP